MDIIETANELCDYLKQFPAIRSCRIYGSLHSNTHDNYSDIDIEIDVSGHDNSLFLTRIPARLSQTYNIIFCDYAPSLVPEKHLLTVALFDSNPFMVVDVSCTATPYFSTLSRPELAAYNTPYDHTLKLFIANLKHYLRQSNCHDDIVKMYRRIFAAPSRSDAQMLTDVFHWLKQHAQPKHINYLSACEAYLQF